MSMQNDAFRSRSNESSTLLDVSGMMCGGCVPRVKSLLSADDRVQIQTFLPNPYSLKTLILLIQSSPQDLKPSLTKSIYLLLLHSSLNAPLHRSDFKSVRTLSNILLEDLNRRFKQVFFSDLRDIFQGTRSSAKVWANMEQLILILRCCLVALNLLEFDLNLLWKKVRVLLLIVRVLVSLVSGSEKNESSVKFEKLFGDDGDGDGCTASVSGMCLWRF